MACLLFLRALTFDVIKKFEFNSFACLISAFGNGAETMQNIFVYEMILGCQPFPNITVNVLRGYFKVVCLAIEWFIWAS